MSTLTCFRSSASWEMMLFLNCQQHVGQRQITWFLSSMAASLWFQKPASLHALHSCTHTHLQGTLHIAARRDFFLEQNCTITLPCGTLNTALHSLLEKPLRLRLAELGHYDSILPYLYRLSPHPRQSCQNPAISCLRAFAYAVPCVFPSSPCPIR